MEMSKNHETFSFHFRAACASISPEAMNNAERITDLRTQGSRTGRKAASAGILPAGDAGRKHNKLRRGNPLCVGRLRGLRGAAGYHEQSGAHHAAADAAGGRSRDAGLSARDRRGLAVRDFFGAKSEFFPVCTGHAGAFLI